MSWVPVRADSRPVSWVGVAVDSRSPVWPAVRPSTTVASSAGQQGAERALQLRRAQHAEDRGEVAAGEGGEQVARLGRREGGKRARQLGGRQRAEQAREVGAGGGGEQVAGLAGREGAERGLQLGRRQPGEGAGQVGPGQRREQVAGLGRGERAQGAGQLPVVGRGLQQLGGLQGVRGDQQVADVRRAEEEDQRLDEADRRAGDRGQQPRDVDPEQARADRSGVRRVRGRGDRREACRRRGRR